MDIRQTCFYFVALFLVLSCVPVHAKQWEASLIEVRKIWDKAPHSAFTDLVRFNDRWYCTFREGERHVHGKDGEIRVIVSEDGRQWESAALFIEDGIDLRDPKLSVTPDGRLMLLIGGSIYREEKMVGRQPRVTFSDDGTTWEPLQLILSNGEWLWRVTWHQGRAYGVSYTSGDLNTAGLFVSDDGINYEPITRFEMDGFANETTLRFFPDGEMIALVRRDKGNTMAWIGTSKPPYTDWSWTETKHRVGGPNFIILANGEMIATGRSYPDGAKTVVAAMNRESYEPCLTLPSGGDTSYAGMVWHEDILWISYYSSHEGKSAIYFAEVSLREKAESGQDSGDTEVFSDNGIRVTQGQTRSCFTSQEHCNFPRYTQLPNGDCYLSHSLGVHTVNERHMAHVSTDRGKTWAQRESAAIPSAVLRNGTAISLGFRTKKESDNSFAVTCSTSEDNWRTVSRNEVTVAFPIDLAWVCCHGRPIQLSDGTILAGVYGSEKDKKQNSSFVIASKDNGNSWEYQGAVARPPYGEEIGAEGANESALVELANGDILCMIRTGGGAKPCLLQAKSSDFGKTWSTPVVLMTPGRVDPQLLLLESGVLVCSFGRPNVNLMFSSKGDGSDWSKPFVFYDGMGDHYTSLWALGESRFVLAWCRSGFCSRNIEGLNEVLTTEFSVVKE